MNESINNIMIGDINGVPSLPLFIGNYLLDLLSTFFPILLLLTTISIVYMGFTKGNGDWKQTMYAISPQVISIFVILGLLSMKTPYKGGNGDDFWKDTNSYTIVEMLTTFIGIGDIFADALTQKMIYGRIDLSGNTTNPDFNGYFPSMLQAQIEASHKANIEKKNTFKENEYHNLEIEKQIEDLERGVASQMRKLVSELKEVEFLNNPHNPQYGFLFEPKIEIPIKRLNEYDYTILGKAYDASHFPSEIEINFYKHVNNTRKYLTMSPSFENDIFMINVDMLRLKLSESQIYSQEIDKLKAITNNDYVEKKINSFEKKKSIVLNQINMLARFQKDLVYLFENAYSETKEHYFKEQITKLGVNYDALGENTIITEIIQEEFKSKLNGLRSQILKPKGGYMIEHYHGDAIERYIKDSYLVKAKITNELYIKLYNILKQEAKDRLETLDSSNSIFATSFLNEDRLKELLIIDGERMTLHKKYVDNVTGEIDVKAKLNEIINYKETPWYKSNSSKETTLTQQNGLITWYDLGKHYNTFKNLFSPLITSSIANQQLELTKEERNEKLVKFLSELEPVAKNERMSSAANWYAAGSVATNVFSGAINKVLSFVGIEETKKSSGGSGLLSALATIGLVPLIIFFINVILPAFIWMLVIISYYLEMSVYIAIFPIAFMFMIFQSYRQSMVQYVNVLIGFILLPIVLTSMYFIILYVDLLLPLFLKQFLPFFGSYGEFSVAFNSTMDDSMINKGIAMAGGSAMTLIGNTIYTIINLVMSTILLLTLFRGNEYMSKILNVSVIGQDNFQGRETINKFSNFNSTSLSKV